MGTKRDAKKGAPDKELENVADEPQADQDEEGEDEGSAEEIKHVSAKDLPGPETLLDSRPDSQVGNLKVSLIPSEVALPTLEEVEAINQNPDVAARTPLMTVVLAVLQNAGGTMKIKELVEKVALHWNRPFPTSPYTPEEVVYMVTRNSDHVRIGS